MYLHTYVKDIIHSFISHNDFSIWKQKQVEIIIAHDDITTEEGCKTVLQKANNLAPLYSIFHLAAVFRDALFEHQTIESYQKTFSVKAKTLRHLDRITRTFYPNLRYSQNFRLVCN